VTEWAALRQRATASQSSLHHLPEHTWSDKRLTETGDTLPGKSGAVYRHGRDSIIDDPEFVTDAIELLEL
jgi:ubiquinone biosynthesis protein COQ9